MQTPSKVSSLVLATAAVASLIALSGSPALARGAGGGAGGGMSTGAGMQGNTSAMSSSHISAQGQANTNGPDASDRDTGRARAEDRMSASGLKHNHAGINESVDTSTRAGASSNAH